MRELTQEDDLERLPHRLRYVNCETCGGTGEIIRRDPGRDDPAYEYATICRACEGYGRECVADDNDVIGSIPPA